MIFVMDLVFHLKVDAYLYYVYLESYIHWFCFLLCRRRMDGTLKGLEEQQNAKKEEVRSN
jgi:hypothetical protein